MADDEVSMEDLQRQVAEIRAADTGLCDHFERVNVAGLPPWVDVHGARCGCGPEVGYSGSRQLCRNCGRHPEVH